MTERPIFALSRLREIGWSKWDPIGVGTSDWSEDEYDGYLLQAAGQFWHGQTVEAVADYLIKIETEQMGLAAVSGIRSRAWDVATAISEYVETMRA